MAGYLLIRHKVRDFKNWETGYDEHAPKRIDARLTEKYLLRSSDDPNEVVDLLEAQDLSRARRLPRLQNCEKRCKKSA